MKCIPKQELIRIIENKLPEIVSEEGCKIIFQKFGDDWYKSPGEEYELCEINEDRKMLFNRKL